MSLEIGIYVQLTGWCRDCYTWVVTCLSGFSLLGFNTAPPALQTSRFTPSVPHYGLPLRDPRYERRLANRIDSPVTVSTAIFTQFQSGLSPSTSSFRASFRHRCLLHAAAFPSRDSSAPPMWLVNRILDVLDGSLARNQNGL